MVEIKDIQKYEIYLKYLNEKLDRFFEEQAPYICCKEGCSHCCEIGEYPMSEVEVSYLQLGARTLSLETLKQIQKNIEQLKIDKMNYTGEKPFAYKCPFLINKKCSLYKYRAIICRSHGLAFFSKENKIMLPDCVHKGLNYSNVYDPENETISNEKYLASQNKQEPLAHNIRLGFLTNNEITKKIELDFGEIKSLIEWFL